MKITNLKVTGFRSLKNIDWRPGDLNIVIGPNAAGKSNLLDILLMLSCLPKGDLGNYVQSRGGLLPLLWDGKAKSISVQIGLDFSLEVGKEGWEHSRYSLDLVPSGGLGSYEIADERLVSDGTDRAYSRAGALAFDAVRGETPAAQQVKRDESFLSNARTVALFGSDYLVKFAELMSKWNIYQMIDTSLSADVRKAPVARYETEVASDGSNLVSVLHTLYTENKAFAQRVDAAMRAAFENFEELVFPPSPAAHQRVQMNVRWKDLERACPLSDLSDGTLRFLYLIAILTNPYLPPLVKIDEPETGLHPRMMGIVAECAMDAATRTQLILTTHSPEFLDAFRDTQPTVTVAELVDGATQLRTLSGEDLAYWLKEYTLGDIYRTGQLESME